MILLRLLLTFFITLSLAMPAVAADSFHAFIYHRFGDAEYRSTNVSLAEFSSQLQYLHDNRYTVIALGEAIGLLTSGRPLPERCVVLTVDDAYTTFLTGAMPLLRRYRYPATLFVSTDMVGRRGYLGWDDLRTLAREGIEIGNHTATHDSMVDRRRGEDAAAWRERIAGDVRRAQEALRRELGIEAKLFAYPYGEFSRETIEVVNRFGFGAVMGQHSGVIGRASDLTVLPRTPLTGSFATLTQMKEKLACRPLPVRRIAPDDIVLDDPAPPRLTLEVLDPTLDLGRLRLFVNGKPDGAPRVIPGTPRRIEVVATSPLAGRRDKYTLTLPGREKGSFYYFTQPWVRVPRR